MIDKKTLNKEEEAQKEIERLRKKYKNLVRNHNPYVPLKIIETYFEKDRLARLIFLQIALKKKCFINEIINAIKYDFKIPALYRTYMNRTSKLAEFNLITIHKLGNQKDEEMLNRYKSLKTKCPKSKINYFEYDDKNWKASKFVKLCLKLEDYPEIYEYIR